MEVIQSYSRCHPEKHAKAHQDQYIPPHMYMAVIDFIVCADIVIDGNLTAISLRDHASHISQLACYKTTCGPCQGIQVVGPYQPPSNGLHTSACHALELS